MRSTLVVLSWLAFAGCFGAEPPTGTAYVYVRHIQGECPVLQVASDLGLQPCPHSSQIPPGKVCALDQIATLGIPYETVHAVASLSGASAYSGGNLLSVAWQGQNGEVSRLYLDIGPSRGLGALVFPWTLQGSYDQSIGFTEWRGGARTFTARSMFAGMEWERMQGSDDGGLEVNMLGAFSGIDASGAAACRTIGVHAETAHARDVNYDPTWLAANPSVMFDVAATAPDYTDDRSPTQAVVSPGSAGPDPEAAAPSMKAHLPSLCGFHSACGGGGGCC